MTELIFAGAPGIAGKLRGKAFPVDQLAYRQDRGLGWTPTNAQITCFDVNAESLGLRPETAMGPFGDVLLMPESETLVSAVFPDEVVRFVLADIVDLDGNPWAFCTRHILREALNRLHRVGGVRLKAAFEHEFQLKGQTPLVGEAYGRAGFEANRALCEMLVKQIRATGLSPDSIMKEYGPNQYEIVIDPELGVKAADASVIVRELTRSTALSLGEHATFSPILDPDSVGNGVHIHMSFEDDDGTPAAYDGEAPYGMSKLTGAFCAGVLAHLDSILALTAPSVVSYLRLTPHSWSAAFNNLGYRDREAALRICPVTQRDPRSIAAQYNIEYRAADAAACPHLALAAIVHAGCQGIEDELAAPEPTQEDLTRLSQDALSVRGLVRLPHSLEQALDRFTDNETVAGWFPDGFTELYDTHKRAEIAQVADLDPRAQCAAYAETY